MDKLLEQEFRNFIIKNNHPCVMAQTVFKMQSYQMGHYHTMDDATSHKNLMSSLKEYINSYDSETAQFETYIACFPEDDYDDEMSFEKALWKLLGSLHKLDPKSWDECVSMDTEDSNFSFSLYGRAFYIVGMHPKSSRISRQSPYPAIAFNLHSQFEKLRDMGVYQKVKTRIRRRDKKLQGIVNPMLKDFGTESEAKQYSGRAVDKQWKCPFHPEP